MSPDVQVVNLELQNMVAATTMTVNSNKKVSDPNAVLGRGGSNWDDDED